MGNRLAFIFFTLIFVICGSPPVWAVVGPEGCDAIGGQWIIDSESDSGGYCNQEPRVELCGPNATFLNNVSGGGVRCQCSLPSTPDGELKIFFNMTDEAVNNCPTASEVGTTGCGANAVQDQNKNGMCVCKTPWADGNPNRTNSFHVEHLYEYANGNPDNMCPSASFRSTETTSSSCLAGLKDKVRSCANVADETIQTCETKSDKNAGIQRNVSGAANTVNALLQQSAVNSGSVDKCRQAGFLSNAAGYGIGMINTDCKEDIQKCEQSCAEVTGLDVQNLQQRCSSELKIKTAVPNDQARVDSLKAEIEELADQVRTANAQCAAESGSGNTTAGKALASTGAALTSFMNASQQAAACEKALANTQSFVPLTNNCIVGAGMPTPAGCPVNCATSPNNPTCKAMSSTGPAQMAGANGKMGTSLSSLSGIAGSKVGAGGDIDLSGLNDTERTMGEPVKMEPTGSVFGSAGQASAGSAGGTGPATGAGGAGADSDGTDDGSSQGGISGAFSALKSAAGNLLSGTGLFGGSSRNAGKNTKTTPGAAANKNNLSLVRGLANANRNSCFIDSKGQSFCFGPKHKSIFEIMSGQYVNQEASLLRD